MKKPMRRFLFTMCIALILIGGSSAYLITRIAPVGTAYAAKRMCSCVFVSHRDEASIREQELKPYGYISLGIDYTGKTVTGSILGMAKRTAVFRDGLGCTLSLGASEKDLLRQISGISIMPMVRKNLPWPDGDLEEHRPLPASVDSIRLETAVASAFSEPDPSKLRRTRSVIVVYDGDIVAERYAPGFTRDTPQLGWSMSKSVTNALTGILVGDGKLVLKAPAPVSEWRSPGDRRSIITLDQLLRMSSGLRFREDYDNPASDVVRMLFAEPDTGAFAASMPLESPPDSRWHYSSGTANIISRLVCRASGGALKDYFVFPRKALFEKTGMASAVFEPDTSGVFTGSSFLYATARDWARFGLLCLRDGIWNGERILPEGWIKYSTTPTPRAPKGKYGAQFWLNAGSPGNAYDRWMPGVPADMYSLRGFEGQYVSVIPSKKLVVVRLGLSVPDENWNHEQFLSDIVEAVSGKGAGLER